MRRWRFQNIGCCRGWVPIVKGKSDAYLSTSYGCQGEGFSGRWCYAKVEKCDERIADTRSGMKSISYWEDLWVVYQIGSSADAFPVDKQSAEVYSTSGKSKKDETPQRYHDIEYVWLNNDITVQMGDMRWCGHDVRKNSNLGSSPRFSKLWSWHDGVETKIWLDELICQGRKYKMIFTKGVPSNSSPDHLHVVEMMTK